MIHLRSRSPPTSLPTADQHGLAVFEIERFAKGDRHALLFQDVSCHCLFRTSKRLRCISRISDRAIGFCGSPKPRPVALRLSKPRGSTNPIRDPGGNTTSGRMAGGRHERSAANTAASKSAVFHHSLRFSPKASGIDPQGFTPRKPGGHNLIGLGKSVFQNGGIARDFLPQFHLSAARGS